MIIYNTFQKNKKIIRVLLMVLVLFALTSCLSDAEPVTEAFQLQFLVDGVPYGESTTNSDSAVKIPQNPTKSGYKFQGWYTDSAYTTGFNIEQTTLPLTENISVYAKFTPIQYQITYSNIQDAENSNANTYTVEDGNIQLSAAVKHGYHFDGWYNGTEMVTSIDANRLQDISLEAKWTMMQYHVTYADVENANHNNITSYNVETENLMLTPATKPNYTFLGWYFGNNKLQEVPLATTEDVVLTAKWTPTPYRITYSGLENGMNLNPITYNIESGKIELSSAIRAGYTFEGWYDNENHVVTSIPAGTSGNISLYARWSLINYQVTFANVADATHNNIDCYTAESSNLTLLPASKPNYTFLGWYYRNIPITTLPIGTNSEITLTAKWAPIVYNITFNGAEGATNTNVPTYTVESDRIILSDASKPGYRFEGWYGTNGKVTEIEAGSCGNITLRAEWTLIVYNITFNGVEGATNTNVPTYTVESGRIVLQAPVYEDRDFLGWYTPSGTRMEVIPAGNVGHITLIAKWQVHITGVVYKSDTDYDDTNNLPLIGATVKLVGSGVNKTVTTDSNGRYSFTSLPLGEYTITITLSNYNQIVFVVQMDGHLIRNDYMDITQSSVINGTVLIADNDTNYSNNNTLSGATVSLTKYSGTNTLTKSVLTSSSGKYSFTNLTAGIYKIVVSKSGYVSVEQYVMIEEGTINVQNMALEVIPQSASGTTIGTASGMIYDASVQGDSGIAGLTLQVRAGINNVATGTVIQTITTTTNGGYILSNMEAGSYTITVIDNRVLANEDLRYETSYFNVKIIAGATISNQNGSVYNNADFDTLKIVLEWGSTPSDLDSHLTGPVSSASSNRYHVYYSNKDQYNANLDRDDTSSYGPETTTIELGNVKGVYRFSVHDYSNKGSTNSRGIANSGATVKVYAGNRLLATYYAPDSSGTLWTVFEYDATIGALRAINTMSNQSLPANIL